MNQIAREYFGEKIAQACQSGLYEEPEQFHFFKIKEIILEDFKPK